MVVSLNFGCFPAGYSCTCSCTESNLMKFDFGARNGLTSELGSQEKKRIRISEGSAHCILALNNTKVSVEANDFYLTKIERGPCQNKTFEPNFLLCHTKKIC